MKRYVKTNTKIDMKLPSLDKAIAQLENDEYSEFIGLDFRYYVEDDGVDGSVLVWISDWSETICSYEYYNYESIRKEFEKFDKAVQKDTGDIDFYFEPYDNVRFCGRAWFSLKNTTGKIFPNSIG